MYGTYAITKLSFNATALCEDEISLEWCKNISPENSDMLHSISQSFYNTFTVNNWDAYTLEGTTYWFDGFVGLAGLFAIDKYMKNV